MSLFPRKLTRPNVRVRPIALRRLDARALSYSSISRGLRVSIAGVIIGAGGLAYATYKFQELRNKIFSRVASARDAATDLFHSASDRFKSVSARVSAVKRPDIETPPFRKDHFSSDDTGLLDSAADKFKSVSARVSAVKLSERTSRLKDRIFSSDNTGHSSSQELGNSESQRNRSPEGNE